MLWLIIAAFFSYFALLISAPRPIWPVVNLTNTNMRSLAAALENYHTDHGMYPKPIGGAEFRLDTAALTTPVAYVSPFVNIDNNKETMKISSRGEFFSYLLANVPAGLVLWLAGSLCFLAGLIGIAAGLRKMDRLYWTSWRIGIIVFYLPVIVFFSVAWNVFLRTQKIEYAYYDKDESSLSAGLFGNSIYIVRNPQWKDRYLGFHYFSDGHNHWVLQSVGPDGRLDFHNLDKLAKDAKADREILQGNTYDPSNGIQSAGDIFRNRQLDGGYMEADKTHGW